MFSETHIWLITYKGQEVSPFTWTANTQGEAIRYKEELEKLFPDREWTIFIKDVS